MSGPCPTDCIVCFKSVPSDGNFNKCGSCNHVYHLEAYSGISDKICKSVGAAKRDKWICRTCRTHESRLNVRGVTEASSTAEDDVSLQLSGINTKLELLYSLKANVDWLCDLPAKVDDRLSLKPSVNTMKKTMKSLQESVKYESVMKLAEANDKEGMLFRSVVGALERTVSER